MHPTTQALAAGLLVIASTSTFAATHYVNANSFTPASPYMDWSSAALTIQDAVDVSSSGDEIVVTNGIYATGGRVVYGSLTNRVAVNKAVAVRSVNGPLVTIIEGYQVPGTVFGDTAVRCIYLANWATLSGFTLANGATRGTGQQILEQSGGGVWCEYNASVTNCIITGNVALWFGGGAYSGTLNNCLLIGNSSTNSGGGACSNYLNNCTVADNSSMYGAGGVAGAVLKNSIVYFNGGLVSNHSTSYFLDSDTTPAPSTGSGNISADPLFIDLGGRNLRLQSNSPCINAGNNGNAPSGPDLDGKPRILGIIVDIGAYEFQGPFASIIRYVNLNNPSPVPPYTNWATAATNIQEAVDASVVGDEIVVTNGTYATGGRAVYGTMTNRVVLDKAVTVRSVNGPQFTVIQGYQIPGTTNGDGAVRCGYLSDGASLSGFTLTGGATHTGGDLSFERSGGAAWCTSQFAVISNCVVASNSANANGAVHGGTVFNCILTNNRVGASSCLLSNCFLSGNWEGAAYLSTLYRCTLATNGYGANQCTVNNCLILDNHGSGADFSTVNNSVLANNWGLGRGNAFGSTLNNCTLAGDPATYYATTSDSSTLKNCVLYYTSPGSSTLSYCCTWPYAASGTGNINLDPKLVNVADKNWRFLSSSPCINAGLNANAPGSVDLDGNPRIFGATVDMGAYEFQGPPTPAAPYFLLQPQPANVTVYASTTVTFNATVYGTPPMSYQWTFGLTELPGATNSSLTLTNVQVNQSGIYFLTVTNIAGKATSSNAYLTVNPALVVGTHYVDPNSANPTYPFTNWVTAATNIQDAIDASTNGDQIIVTNGIYATGGRPGNRVTVDRGVTLRSVNGPQRTIIDGAASVRCVELDRAASLIGFTITNGFSYSGAGISCPLQFFPSGRVQNCILVGNSANPNLGGTGGGAAGGVFDNCLLAFNTAYQGGAGYFTYEMNNCTVVSNTATLEGGGIWSTNGTLNNCIIYYNAAPSGPNWAGSGLRMGPALQRFCCTMPAQEYGSGRGNITNAPLFVDLAGGNLRLQSNSPCINAGTNFYVVGAIDLDGRPRIVGGTVDIGAYEFQPGVSGAFIGWLQLNGLPTDGSADNTDSDGDGLSNWQEYLANRNPLVWDNLTLQGSTGPQDSGFQLTVHGQPGTSYALQVSTNLADWTHVMQVDCAYPSGTAIVFDPGSKNYSRRFYRLAPLSTVP